MFVIWDQSLSEPPCFVQVPLFCILNIFSLSVSVNHNMNIFVQHSTTRWTKSWSFEFNYQRLDHHLDWIKLHVSSRYEKFFYWMKTLTYYYWPIFKPAREKDESDSKSTEQLEYLDRTKTTGSSRGFVTPLFPVINSLISIIWRPKPF